MNDAFYIIKPAVGTKETGMAYPAVESFADYDFNAANSASKIRAGEFPDFVPELRFKLAKGAKLCDIMGQATIGGHGFLISEKFKTVLEKADLVPHKFYHATIQDKEVVHQYYWIHFVWDDSKNIIHFQGSDFFARKFSKNLGKVIIESEDQILIQKSKFDISTSIDFNSLSLKKFNKDLFFFNFFIEIYVTKKLKELIQSHNLTGIEFEETNKLHLQS